MKEMQGKVIESVGTVRNYEQALKTCCDYLKENRLGALREITPEAANQYLALRATECSQRTVNMDRQALQAMMRHVTGALPKEGRLDTSIKSTKDTIEQSRSYTPDQVQRITEHQTPNHALATQICQASGLRAHELYTLRPTGEVTPSDREVHSEKFTHMPSETRTYTVAGKGGLIREVQIPTRLAEQLEQLRYDTPRQVTDRNVNYTTHYAIPAGHGFSDAFSKASVRALGYSHGAHGLRHTYAQDRYQQLANHLPREDVMSVISQELGHFRPDITEVYLR